LGVRGGAGASFGFAARFGVAALAISGLSPPVDKLRLYGGKRGSAQRVPDGAPPASVMTGTTGTSGTRVTRNRRGSPPPESARCEGSAGEDESHEHKANIAPPRALGNASRFFGV